MSESGTESDEDFTLTDFEALSALVIDRWTSGLDRDWSVPAGTLEWSCFHTADHVVDCVFSYALFLASRRQESYPPFGELHALPGATPRDLVDGLRATTEMLTAVIALAPPNVRAIITQRPAKTGTPGDFAARGGLELSLHAHDVCTGLGLDFRLPPEASGRLLAHSNRLRGRPAVEPTADPWADLVEQSGRPRPS